MNTTDIVKRGIVGSNKRTVLVFWRFGSGCFGASGYRRSPATTWAPRRQHAGWSCCGQTSSGVSCYEVERSRKETMTGFTWHRHLSSTPLDTPSTPLRRRPAGVHRLLLSLGVLVAPRDLTE